MPCVNQPVVIAVAATVAAVTVAAVTVAAVTAVVIVNQQSFLLRELLLLFVLPLAKM